MSAPSLLGLAIRSRREAQGRSRAEVARAAQTSESTVLRFEVHGHVPNGRALLRILATLGVPLIDVIEAITAAEFADEDQVPA